MPASSKSPISWRALFTEALDVAEGAFHRLASQVPSPAEQDWGELGFVYRYNERSVYQALVLKLARQVSGLHALDVLLLHGLVQEQGVIQRTLDEIGEDILFLAHGAQEGLAPLHEQYLYAFWAEEF